MPVETRYFKNESVTVNGLSAYALALDLTGSGHTFVESRATYYEGCNVGIRVWKRHADETETEITSGTPVAQVTVINGDSHVLKTATWDCPGTSLEPTDSIVVRVYHNIGDTWDLLSTAVFTTEQLNASSLDASTWTVYYYLSYTATLFPSARSTVSFHIDGDDPSRIENFSWSAVPPPVVAKKLYGDGLVWILGC